MSKKRGYVVPLWLGGMLFCCWVIFVAVHFNIVKWLDPRALVAAFTPELSTGHFSWVNVAEVARRFFIGHSGIFLWIISILGMGVTLLRVFVITPNLGRAEYLAYSFGLGIAIAMPLWLALGLVGLWLPAVAWFVSGCGICLIGHLRCRLPKKSKAERSETIGSVEGWLIRLLVIEVTLTLILVISACVAPGMDPDAVIVYLASPEQYVLEHKIVGQSQLLHSWFPLGASVLYGAQWLMGGEPVARAWRVWLIAAALWCLFRLCSRLGYRHAGWGAAVIFLTMPVVMLNTIRMAVDVEAGVLVLLGCLAVLQARVSRRPMLWCIMCGVYSGAALASKYTAMIWVP